MHMCHFCCKVHWKVLYATYLTSDRGTVLWSLSFTTHNYDHVKVCGQGKPESVMISEIHYKEGMYLNLSAMLWSVPLDLWYLIWALLRRWGGLTLRPGVTSPPPPAPLCYIVTRALPIKLVALHGEQPARYTEVHCASSRCVHLKSIKGCSKHWAPSPASGFSCIGALSCLLEWALVSVCAQNVYQ